MKHTCAAVNSNEIWLCSSETSNTLNLDMIGYDKSKSCVSININDRKTTPRASLASPHIHGNMVSIIDQKLGDTLIIIGGRHLMTDNNPEPTDQVEFCDRECVIGNGNWETLPPLPEKLYSGQTSVNTKSKIIYYFGGEAAHHTSKNVFALEFGPRKWVSGEWSISRWRPWVKVGELQVARSQGQVVFDKRSEVFWLVGGTVAGIENWSEDTESGRVITNNDFDRRQFSLILIDNKRL